MSFVEEIQKIGNKISFKRIRDIAISHLPTSKAEQDKLYDELIRGTQILDDEPHMNMYLKCYGLMHQAKIEYALDCLSRLLNIERIFTDEIEMFDWGCGQGLATICTLDYLRNHKILPNLRRITLVEPSLATITRAQAILQCYPECANVEIRIVNKKFDELSTNDISSLNCRKLHLFSNILDVTCFDLAKFTQLFQKTQKGGNYIICVGPLNKDYKRIDWFIEAINPDYKYVSEDKARGMWQGNWTMVLRIIARFVQEVEDIAAIRKRITEAQCHSQMFAGYVTDALSDTLSSSEYASKAEELMSYLSMFDVKSNKPLNHGKDIESIYAVMSNIISRGMPTRPSILIEENMVRPFAFSHQPIDNPVEYHYNATDKCSAKSFFEALHVIYPKWNINDYNKDILESNFESAFIRNYLPENDKEYLVQLLEPQRLLSSIIDIPNQSYKQFSQEQRVDFAMEIPYTPEKRERKTGIVVEINGKQYHSSISSKIKDARRDTLIRRNNNWNTFNIESTDDKTFSDSIDTSDVFSSYLEIMKKNYCKDLSGEWKDIIQFVLSPFAIARVEKIIIEALISGYLNIESEKWNIAVIERDVPCAAIAIKDIKELFENLCMLRGTNEKFPIINLSIISTPSFADSPLHNGYKVKVQQKESLEYDICIDISVLFRDKIAEMPISLQSKTYYICRSSHYSKQVRNIYCAENINYLPLVTKTPHGEYIEIQERKNILQYFLQNIFRKHDFREGQLPILSRILTNKTTIGLLPTGGGKSLTYQLSSLLQPGVTIVVDPLVSLMVDQYNGLINQRIDVTSCINSSMDRQEKMFHLGRMMEGQVQFMLLSPERFMMKEDFRDEIIQMRNNNVFFAYGVIDEVHTVSEWGHDFRPAYLQLGRNMTRFMQTKSGDNIVIVGLTATASFDVLADVERELTLGGELSLDSDAIVKPEISEREELTYHIEQVKANFYTLVDGNNNPYVLNTNNAWDIREVVTNAKRQHLVDIFDRIPNDINTINANVINSNEENHGSTHIDNFRQESFYTPDDNGKYKNAGIVFCPYREGGYGVNDKITTRNSRQGMANFIQTAHAGLNIGTFIGGDNPTQMAAFKHNKQNLMVATKAFGMGIDKPNVRYTINVTHPSSIESYVQEAGRAGRDKKVAISYLLHEPTEYVQLTAEVISGMCGNNIPAFIGQLVDKFILWKDVKNVFKFWGVSDNIINGYINHLARYKQNADKDVQMYFHNNSFKGVEKEKIMLDELYYNPNVTLNIGIYDAIRPLRVGESTEVVIPSQNTYYDNPAVFNQMVLGEAQNIAMTQGWTIPQFLNAYEKTLDEVFESLARNNNTISWMVQKNAGFMEPLKRAFYKKRDKDDTDKAIYRMCCIGLIDDVTIEYVNPQLNIVHYTVKVSQKAEESYFEALQYFFEKYYSAEQALRKTNEAREHTGRTAADKCMNYLAEFVYENLEPKRRRAVDDMRDACLKGASMGDDALKEYIHLYFNSKYARDTHDVNGMNYSLKQDVEEGKSVFETLWKYIDVMNTDPSGSEADNIKHLYGAVLIILRAQAKDNISTPVLYLLRSFCLACLGTNNNDTLIDEFKEGYSMLGFNEIINSYQTQDPTEIKKHITQYNEVIKKKAKTSETYLYEYIQSLVQELNLRILNRFYNDYTISYTE